MGESKESMRRGERLLGLVLEESDEVVSVLGLLEATEGHLGAGDVLLGVLEVLELDQGRQLCTQWVCIRSKHTSVSVPHSTPFCLLASVYEKPSTWPDLRPKRPCRLGPILLPSPSFRVWH